MQKERITYEELAKRIREWMSSEEIELVFGGSDPDDVTLVHDFLNSPYSYQEDDGSYATQIGTFELID